MAELGLMGSRTPPNRRRQETQPPVEPEEPNEQEVRERIMGHSKATMVRSHALKDRKGAENKC